RDGLARRSGSTPAAGRAPGRGTAAAVRPAAGAGSDAAAAGRGVSAAAARPAAARAGAGRGRGRRPRAGHRWRRDGAGAAGPAPLAGAGDRVAGPARALDGDLAPARSRGMSVVAALDLSLRRVRRRAALDALLAWAVLPLAAASLL